MAFIRQTAIPCTAAQLKEGGYLQEPGVSGIATTAGLVNRASIVGIIVEKNDSVLVIDDGTGTLQAQSTQGQPIRVDVGDAAIVIGRPQEYNGLRYLELEIAKKLRSHGWIAYRRRELETLEKRAATPHREIAPTPPTTAPPEKTQAPVQSTSAPEPPQNPLLQIINAIRAADDGSGADVQDALASITHPEKDRLLRILLEEGEIFEVRPGRVKVLE